MVFLKKILVTTDLSEFSLAAFDYASTASLLFNADIYLLHVIEGGPGGRSRMHGDRERQSQALINKEEALKALQDFVRSSISSELNVTTVVRSGSPPDEIIRFAKEEGIDMIVIATHGRTGLKHIMMGSVAEKIVRRSSVPVLSVKPGPIRDQLLKNEDIENELHLR
jgi:nucleotide-binding universal stress UspA family protein